MIKYIPEDTQVVFREIPDEVTLALNISNCQHHCDGCHSPYLRENIGEELDIKAIDELLCDNDGVSCVCFMGEGNDPEALQRLILHIKECYKTTAVALYTGADDVEDDFYWQHLDYIKIGHYDKKRGPIDNPKTNQRLYIGCPICGGCVEVNGVKRFGWKDITDSFWK
jgi:anaerobic ribonucleoside-triphosphate reductase activating protein